ncbi:hypothetical protein ACQKLP_16575 [Chitinophaga sp. NPDC101104]|uniref:hypothetical protein n=1 Tax=Chitinophaga sp. NPDC101104 TaxID=3390561 RepID=UPI003D052AB5
MEECKSTGMLTRDLLASIRLQAPPRASLVPLWMHLLMGLLVLLYVLCVFIGIFTIEETLQGKEDAIYKKWFSFVMSLVIFMFAALVAGCVLIWCSWRQAVNFTVAPAVMVSLLMLLCVVVCFADERSWRAIYVVLPFTFLQLAFNVRLFLIQRQWKLRPRKKGDRYENK